MDFRTSATAVILPPKAPETPSLQAGEHVITVVSVRGENDGLFINGEPAPSEHQEVVCQYPDGLRKTHQVKSGDDLFARIAETLRYRFGVFEFIFKSPATIPQPNETITIGVE